jgi:hypothetical protein
MSPAFRQRLSAAFAEIRLGDRFTYRRTLTDGSDRSETDPVPTMEGCLPGTVATQCA